MSPKTTKAPSRWAAYVRVSRTSEAAMSPEEQRDTITEYANRNHIEIASDKWFTDLDISGAKMRRKSFDQLMALALDHEIDGIVVARVSRFGRTLVGALAAIEQLDKAGVLFKSATEPLDTTNAAGKLFLGQVLLIAEWELNRIRENWSYFTKSAVRRGVPIGHGNHYGYTRKGKGRGVSDEDRRLRIVPDEAPIVREMFRRRADKQTWSGIAAWLNEEHPRGNGLRWSHQTVRAIVQNRIYTGAVVYGDQANANAHEPVVTLAQFDAANAVVGGRAPSEHVGETPLLASLLRCASCRYTMTKVTDKKTGKVRGYKCNRHQTTGDCPTPAFVKADDIESIVLTQFKWYHFHSERLLQRPDLAAVSQAEARLSDMERRYDDVADNDELRELNPDRFMAMLQRRQAMIEQATEELKQARARVEQDTHRPRLLEDDWDAMSYEEQRAILRRAIDSVYVQAGDKRRGKGRDDFYGMDANLCKRTLIRWNGEDDWDRPKRGGRGVKSNYVITPVPFPEVVHPAQMMFAVNVPQWMREPGAWDRGLTLPPELAASLSR
jgi:site-specific DNA recombinase